MSSATSISSMLAAGAASILLAAHFTAGFLGRPGHNPWSPTQDVQRTLSRTFPQQGPFFTKSPLDPSLYLYQSTEDGWSRHYLDKGLGLGNLMGFQRRSRVTGRELSMVSKDLMPFEWFDCEGTAVTECLDTPPTTATMPDGFSEFPELCGSFALVTTKQADWVWRDQSVSMPTKFAKFEVPCS